MKLPLSIRILILSVVCFLAFTYPKAFSFSEETEICDNGIDDNGDGLIDLNDPCCFCEIVVPISLIPNPSFEDLNCCPYERSQLDCAETWVQASEPTTDLIHTCDWLGWDDFPPPTPFPDGEGIMGFRDGRVRGNNQAEKQWKEYAGACLLSPLEEDSTYRFEFDVGFVSSLLSPPIDITFFGTTDCSNIPFGIGNEAFGCPTNGPNWQKLGSTWVDGGQGNRWRKASIEVTPSQDIYAIAIGPSCSPITASQSIYYFFDNLLLADFKSFDLQIKEISHACQNDFRLQIPENKDFEYQWYKEGVALLGETQAQLSQIYGEGMYQVRIQDGASCRLSHEFEYKVPIIEKPVSVTICNESTYPFGDLMINEPGTYVDTFKNVNNCDSIVTLNLSVLGKSIDTISAKIFEGEEYKLEDQSFKDNGNHLVLLKTDLGCERLVLLQLDYYHIYFANIFSPNGDGLNDFFTAINFDEDIDQIRIRIYDRWGTNLYDGDAWDGYGLDKKVNPGLYTYVADITMNDRKSRRYIGAVTVVF